MNLEMRDKKPKSHNPILHHNGVTSLCFTHFKLPLTYDYKNLMKMNNMSLLITFDLFHKTKSLVSKSTIKYDNRQTNVQTNKHKSFSENELQYTEI